jgi:hypothetical protein
LISAAPGEAEIRLT